MDEIALSSIHASQIAAQREFEPESGKVLERPRATQSPSTDGSIHQTTATSDNEGMRRPQACYRGPTETPRFASIACEFHLHGTLQNMERHGFPVSSFLSQRQAFAANIYLIAVDPDEVISDNHLAQPVIEIAFLPKHSCQLHPLSN